MRGRSISHTSPGGRVDATKFSYLNVIDINRIEANCQNLADILNLTITTKTWTETDFPSNAELQRIKGNIDTLRNAYYTYQTSPLTPDSPLNIFWKFNNIEKILNDIHEIYAKNKNATRFIEQNNYLEDIGVI